MEGNLPIGLIVEGKEIKTFKIKRLTGRVEEAMLDRSITNNAGKVTTALLKGCLEELGFLTENQITPQLINKLTIIDRDYLMVQIRIESYGEIIKSVIKCPDCKRESELEVNLKGLECRFESGVVGTFEVDLE